VGWLSSFRKDSRTARSEVSNPLSCPASNCPSSFLKPPSIIKKENSKPHLIQETRARGGTLEEAPN
jgi:hypothetical protein